MLVALTACIVAPVLAWPDRVTRLVALITCIVAPELAWPDSHKVSCSYNMYCCT